MNARTHMPRPESDAFVGEHRFRTNGGSPLNAFEVFYIGRDTKTAGQIAGWYWRPIQIPKLPTKDPIGPFTSSRAAYRDARSQC